MCYSCEKRASHWRCAAAAAALMALVACDRSTADLVRELEAAREGCTEEMLTAGSEECVRMFERYIGMGNRVIETYIGGARAFEEALRRQPELGFDTAGLGRALSTWGGRANGIGDGELFPQPSRSGARQPAVPPLTPPWIFEDPEQIGSNRNGLGIRGADDAWDPRRQPMYPADADSWRSGSGGRAPGHSDAPLSPVPARGDELLPRRPTDRDAWRRYPGDAGGSGEQRLADENTWPCEPPPEQGASQAGRETTPTVRRGVLTPPAERLRRPWISDERTDRQYYPGDDLPAEAYRRDGWRSPVDACRQR